MRGGPGSEGARGGKAAAVAGRAPLLLQVRRVLQGAAWYYYYY